MLCFKTESNNIATSHIINYNNTINLIYDPNTLFYFVLHCRYSVLHKMSVCYTILYFVLDVNQNDYYKYYSI